MNIFERSALILWLSMLLVATVFLVVGEAQAQESVCLVSSSGEPVRILDSIQLSAEIPEVISADSKPVGAFHNQRLVVSFEPEPGHKMLLSATPDGCGWPRTDDYGEIRTSSGRVWSKDYRSAGRDKVQEIAPVDITYLFEAGEQELFLTLIDLTGPAYSSRAYCLLHIYDPIASTPTLAPPTATSTPEPTPSPTATSSPTATKTPARRPSPTAMPVASMEREQGSVFPSYLLWLLGLGGLLAAAAAGSTILNGRQPYLDLTVIVIEGGTVVAEVELAPRKRSLVTFGSQGDIDLPKLLSGAALLRTQRQGKRVETLFERLDPQTGVVLDSRPVSNGDQVVLGPYRVQFEMDGIDDNFDDDDDF